VLLNWNILALLFTLATDTLVHEEDGKYASGAIAGIEDTLGVAGTHGIGPPTDKDPRKNGGWQTFTIPLKFKNQGDCVSFVNKGVVVVD
jgi:hypothetical protein